MIQEIEIELNNTDNQKGVVTNKHTKRSFFDCSDTEKLLICGVISWYVMLFALFIFLK